MPNSPAETMAEAGVAALVIISILLVMADTPAYPIAVGSVMLAGLYVLLTHPTILPQLSQWAGGKLH